MNDIQNVVERFRKAGLKITPQRLSIFHLLQDNRSHPSAEDIYHRVLEIHPSISFTTVYKTLQTLRDLGEILEISIDPERVHYDPKVDDHYHTYCRKCGTIEDFFSHDAQVPDVPGKLSEDGFRVHSVQVHLVGLCSGCQSTV